MSRVRGRLGQFLPASLRFSCLPNREESSLSLLETRGTQIPEGSSDRTQHTDVHRFHVWSSTFWQFFRYCLVGGANTLMDLLMLNVLLWRFPTNNVLVLMLYNSVAYSSGAVTSFFLNKYWTFGHRQKTTRREVVRFLITLFLEVLYSNGLIWLAGKALQPFITNVTLWGNASKLVAIVAGAIISYAFMRFWTFAGRSQDRPKQSADEHCDRDVRPDPRDS
jgi:putative flippase GtrA